MTISFLKSIASFVILLQVFFCSAQFSTIYNGFELDQLLISKKKSNMEALQEMVFLPLMPLFL